MDVVVSTADDSSVGILMMYMYINITMGESVTLTE